MAAGREAHDEKIAVDQLAPVQSCHQVIQAVVFGLVHAYQGPAGVLGTAINGLIYGGITLAARGSIWPAAIAHGSSNSIGIMELFLAD